MDSKIPRGKTVGYTAGDSRGRLVNSTPKWSLSTWSLIGSVLVETNLILSMTQKTELNVKSGCHKVCIIISTERVVPFVIMIDEKSFVGSKRDIIGSFNILLYWKGHYPSRVQQLAAIQTHNNAYLADQSAG